MNGNPGSESAEKKQVGVYFDQAAQVFDTFYEEQRGPVMRWIDHHFRSDIYERFDLAMTSIATIAEKSILDIGCGSGPYSVECARRGAAHVVGLDCAPNMLELAQKRAMRAGVEKSCQFVCGTFPDDAPEEVFDHCLVMGVLDYVADPQSFLRTLADRTRVSAIMSFPSWHWFRGPLRLIRYRLKRCPLWLYRRQQVADLMSKSPFTHFEIQKIAGAGMDFVVIAKKV